MGFERFAAGRKGVGQMVERTGKGANYRMSPPPQSGGLEELRNWCVREYDRISTAIEEGRSNSLRPDVLPATPVKPVAGMIAVFAAGVAGPQAGAYEFIDTEWRKL